MSKTLSTRVTALESDVVEMKGDIKAVLALLQAGQPAKTETRKAAAKKATPAPKAETPEWIKKAAARRASNADMSAWMRSKGIHPGGSAWEACKAGERNVRTLKALNAKDAKARKNA